MSETELRRLIYVARWRPLAELGRETERLPAEELPASTKSRRTWKAKPLAFESLQEAVAAAKAKLADKPERIAALERLGRERALIYKLAVLTGCRRGEIESLTVGHLDLDAGVLRLRPQDTKNGDAADLALRGDLVEDLRAWLETLQPEATGSVVSMRQASRLRPETPLFEVCRQFVKTLNRDLAVAGIAKRDDRGRTVDFHALRTTFGTLLSVNGVAPRTAQQAMRHSEIGLTMNVYTDPKLLDLVGAVEALPHLRLDDMPTAECERLLHSTGTDGALSRVQRTVAPTVAPTAALTCHFEAKTGSLGNVQRAVENRPELHKTKGNAGFLSVGVTGFEPAASASRTKTTSVGIADSERVYNESIRALHQLLHQGGSLTHAVEPIERLAELLRDALTSEQRERLAVLLGDSQRRT